MTTSIAGIDFSAPSHEVAPLLIGVTLLVNGVGGSVAWHTLVFEFRVPRSGHGAGVLIRAIEPVAGLDAMQGRRGMDAAADARMLCSGPGKLCQAMAVTRAHNGLALTGGAVRIDRARGSGSGGAGSGGGAAHRHLEGGGVAVALRRGGLAFS